MNQSLNPTGNQALDKQTQNKAYAAHAIIELKSVHYQVSSEDQILNILKGCDLRVQSGESIAIVGRSGSGKSTLLSIIAGLEKPTSGEVSLLGQPIQHLNEDQRAMVRAQGVGFIFQNFQLMPSMTALENILMPLELFQIPHAKAQALNALEKVGLSDRAHHRPGELSGGEQQRVAIARAFVGKPKVLFADEPTGNLDEQTAEHIQNLLFELQTELNTALVLVTHDLDYAQKCDKTFQLLHGVLVNTPPKEESPQ